MTLREYALHRDLSKEALAAWLAEHVGVSRAGARKWVYGERTPRPQQMLRVMELTGGLVTANDFLAPRSTPSEEAA